MIDPGIFRRVLGNFPTGVAVITGLDAGGAPVGLAVGSFASASLDPPLVAFFPDRSSSSWPRIAATGRFCVNILGFDQEAVCRTFAVRGGDKFAELSWRSAPSGAPVLDGVVAWIDCDLEAVHPAGDHDLVLGRVRTLDVGRSVLPLVFFQGGYGRFSPLSLAAWEGDLAVQLRTADLARPQLEDLAARFAAECVASAAVGDEMVLVANASAGSSGELAPRVGQRIPFLPPLGTAFVAWAGPLARRAWLDRAGKDSPPGTVAALEATLAQVRAAGYSVGRGRDWHGALNTVLAKADPTDPADPGHDAIRRLIRSLPPGYESPAAASSEAASSKAASPEAASPEAASPRAEVPRRHADELRTLSAPVFGRDGTAVLVLTLIGVHRPLDGGDDDPVAALRAAAATVTAALGGAQPT
ncbi:flavin reductase [Pseudofrankia inefficax]|uniref:Flavin reductase domain protein FMN-binding protein n=1 Tax=Pseudofrankia inefficax (strain DSM 45817 / CECT 9037 / DDB 130130 / EuI1c) TaxID=298654 RepID=E3J4F7_PSEI1|nr:flavin reductase [Pseudofrankia inefficax]ADP83076.1 flavin reductase domain protein FMN-binding protein [Pseudofrankia inefficax]